ncbi:MAG: hypothetical protein ABII12_11965, partial [Planctomycetota bacterium]
MYYAPTNLQDGLADAWPIATYTSKFLSRQSVSTDVTLELSGNQVGGSTYEITLDVCIEAGGTGKTMRIYMVQVLDHWPVIAAPHNTQRNNFKQAANTHGNEPVVTLAAGECDTIVHTFTFDGDSMAQPSDIKIIAWAQENGTAAAPVEPLVPDVEVYQAAVMVWPFEPPQPAKGDMNGDGTIDSFDVPYFVMALVDRAAYDAEFAAEEYDADYIGDFTGDELLRGDDTQGFVALLLYDDEPPANLAWAEEPHPISSTEIRMAGYAEDRTPPIEFAFDGFVGAHDRSWDVDPVYIDSGLGKNTYFQYYVAARDSSPLQNETGYGLQKTIGTAIETPSELTFGTITSASIEVFTAHDEDVGGLFTNLADS